MRKALEISGSLIAALIIFSNPGFSGEIHNAAREGNLESIRAMLKTNPELLEAAGDRNESPLMTAAGAGQVEIVLFLLEKGANIEHLDTSGRSAILHPSYTGNDEIVEILLEYGADPMLKDARGCTPIRWAAVRGKRSTVDLFSRKGFEVTLHEAAACGHIELMEKALATGARANGFDGEMNTPAHLAVSGNQKDALEFLLAHGADVSIKDKNGLTPLDLAVEKEREKIVSLLKSKGCEETPVVDPVIVRLADGMQRLTFPFYMKTNIVAQAGPDGIILVDTGFSRRAALRLKEEVAAMRCGDITYIINTHEHWDHVQGNFLAGEEGRIISFSVIAKADTNRVVSRVDEPIPGRTGKGFDYYYSMRFNGEEIRMIPFPGIHSENDMLIYFTGSNVVHMGDLLLSQSFPAISNVPRYLEFLDMVIDVFPEETLFVSGHGRESTMDDVREYRKMLQATVDLVEKEIARGKTLNDIRNEKVLKDYESWGEFLTFLNIDSWSGAVFNSRQRH